MNFQGLYRHYTRSITNCVFKLVPELELISKIGLWNTIIGASVYMLACAFYLTPIEREYPQRQGGYTPKSKQSRLSNQIAVKLSSVAITCCNKIQTWIEGSPRPLKHRIVAKQQQLLARKHYSLSKAGNKRKLIVATTILALSAKTLQNQHRSVNFDTDSHPIGVDN